MAITPKEFEGLRNAMKSICDKYGNDIVIIGGWATYFHTNGEMTGDIDMMISHTIQSQFRKDYKNPKLSKEGFVCPTGDDVDVYVAYQNKLKVDYPVISGLAEKIEGFNVACVEHLIVLKLAAARGREHTSKGQKDARDIMRLLALPNTKFKNKEILGTYLNDEDWQFMKDIASNVDVCSDITGNVMTAKKLSATCCSKLKYLETSAALYLVNESKIVTKRQNEI